ncbi:TniQ family protein [Paracoccus sp. 1_MG-2023]|uniref:TniQ family protein n=1 Tax=unclassified Paracoccus (in: a-proteobacteria) TaxID=2688777 RepID=UPI001C0981F9|nr:MULTISPECIES: TniQ family protein [unclassified Paracoccus (in: a-proteobacteria)]MBU2957162.1 TniQ family protein [Paracoccus sp. C2R09]MDO6670339.1 TniQ family protein [Paracoccus sp. 1_MG-2023]
MSVGKLALRHVPMPRETPTSLVSRLAVRNLCPTASDFCLDVGLDWRAVIRGAAGEIDRLAGLAGADRSALQRYALRTVGPSRFRIGRETGTIATIHRSRTKICIECVAESMGRHGFSGAFRSADWQLVSIRTCERHGIWLTSLPHEKFTIDNYDVARCIERHVTLLDETATNAVPSPLEAYLRARLDGVRSGPWLDTLPLHVVSRLCEMLGARMEFGPSVRALGLTEDMLHRAGGIGFAAIKDGPQALRRSLEGLRSAEVRKGGFQHASDLGVLYQWLSASRASRELRPIQQLVRSFIVENYPLDPGRVILGRAIQEPQLLSLEHVRQRLEMRPERVMRLLRQARLHDGDLSRGIRLETASQLKAYTQQFVTTTAAASIIGCHPGQLAQLQNTGLLVPREMEEGVHRLHRDDLDAFVRPIADLPEVAKAGALRTLWKTYNYVKCSIADICRLLLDGQLKSACRLLGPPSLSTVLVDPEEVRRHLIMEAPDDPSAKDTARRLRTNQQTLHHLASQGLLWLNRRRHPVTRSIRWYVERCSLEQFEKRFVTVGMLATELGERPGPLAKRLEALGVGPIYSVPNVSRIYERPALVESTIGWCAEEVPLAEGH